MLHIYKSVAVPACMFRMLSNYLLKKTKERLSVLKCRNIITQHIPVGDEKLRDEERDWIQCAGSHGKWIFFCNRGPHEETLEIFSNVTGFRVGMATFLSLKTETINLCNAKDRLCLRGWHLEHHIDMWPKDAAPVYILLNLKRMDSVNLKLMCCWVPTLAVEASVWFWLDHEAQSYSILIC